MDITQNLEFRFKRNWSQHLPVTWGDGVLVACSGGSDSVALVHLLCLQGWPIVVAHVNHGLRGGESDADEEFVAQLAHSWDCTFTSIRLKPQAPYSGGLQNAARLLRQRWLAEEARRQDCNWIVTGHHLDDQAETILYRLLRSKGNQILQGMKPRQGNRLKPLLFAHKTEIQDWLRSRNFTWREDSSNSKDSYARNLIRNQLNPILTRLHPDYATALSERVSRYTQQWEVLEGYLKRNLRRCLHLEADGEWIRLSAARNRLRGNPDSLVAYWAEYRLKGSHQLQQKALELIHLPTGTTRTADGWLLSALGSGIRASRVDNAIQRPPKAVPLNKTVRFAGWEFRVARVEQDVCDWKAVPQYHWYFSPPLPYSEAPFIVEYPTADQRIQLLNGVERSMSRYIAETRRDLPEGTSLIQLSQGGVALLLLPLRPSEIAKVQPHNANVETYRLWARPIFGGWLPLANDL